MQHPCGASRSRGALELGYRAGVGDNEAKPHRCPPPKPCGFRARPDEERRGSWRCGRSCCFAFGRVVRHLFKRCRPIHLETVRLSGELQVVQPRGRDAIPLPAMNRGDRRFDELGDPGGAPECVHRGFGQSLHGPYSAIIASDFQAESCDSGNCYVRDYDFEEGMDEEAVLCSNCTKP